MILLVDEILSSEFSRPVGYNSVIQLSKLFGGREGENLGVKIYN